MLLTSGQVSVAVSSGIVLLCTAALFLSGYAIQQRTLRDLRAAIKPAPRPSPQIFLPDRFKQSTTELQDGTVVVLDSDDGGGERQQEQPTIKVQTTQPDGTPKQRPVSNEQRTGGAEAGGAQVPKKTTRTGKKKSRIRKKEGGAAGGGNGGAGRGDDTESPQKPISRAERRRRIKEEIMRLSQGQEPVYYQRRLW